jgi:hypothetical protein
MSTFMNPCVDDKFRESERLRQRSETFVRVDEVFQKVSNLKSVSVALFALVVLLSATNLGSSVGANILTRKLTVDRRAGTAAAVQMTDGRNRNVATATSALQGAVRECETYEHIREASSIQAGFAGAGGAKSAFTARVVSVLTVPSPQSACGFYLLVRTGDPLYDVVVSDNASALVSKPKADAIARLVVPSDGARADVVEVAGEASFQAAQTLVAAPVQTDAANAVSAQAREDAVRKAAGLWVLAAFVKGEISCNTAVENVKLPAFVSDSGACQTSDEAFNAIGDAIDVVDFSKLDQIVAADPFCTVNLTSYVTRVEQAIPESCVDEMQLALYMSSDRAGAANGTRRLHERFAREAERLGVGAAHVQLRQVRQLLEQVGLEHFLVVFSVVDDRERALALVKRGEARGVVRKVEGGNVFFAREKIAPDPRVDEARCRPGAARRLVQRRADVVRVVSKERHGEARARRERIIYSVYKY